jgi:hypothetical protein
MADKYDSYLTTLHRLRQIKGALRQDSYKTILRQLQSELQNNIKEPHPYRLVVNSTIDQVKPLLTVPQFKKGAIGSNANHHIDYIYHLTSVRKMAGHFGQPSNLTWTYLPPAFPNLAAPDRKLFECLLYKYINEYGGVGYMPLKNYATGKYSGKRDFSWWTNQKLLATHIVCAAHRLGMPNTWIPKYAIVMRCPAKKVMTSALSHVPTVLDGFISEIFSPSDYRTTTPIRGEALNLDNLGSFAHGAEEYTLNPINVDLIEFYPVLIEKSKRSHHAVYRNARLWQLLEVYYYHL